MIRCKINSRYRRWAFAVAVLLGLSLSGCFEEPKIRADTEANFNTSYAAVTSNLSEVEKAKLDSALKDIVLVQVGLYGPLLEAKNYVPPSNADNIFGGFAKALAGTMTTAISAGVTSNWDANRARAVVQNARAIVDGHTAKEIILIADNERKKDDEAALNIYRDQLTKTYSTLNDLKVEADAAAKALVEQKTLLEKIHITMPRFKYENIGFLEQPAILFTITNRGSIPIKRIYIHGKVQTPGRALPWVESDFNYDFPGGLEPGETQNLDLAPNMFSDWSDVPKEAVNGSVLSLNLVAFEGPDGKRIGEPTTDRKRIEDRKKALEDGIRDLEGKIRSLEQQLIGYGG